MLPPSSTSATSYSDGGTATGFLSRRRGAGCGLKRKNPRYARLLSQPCTNKGSYVIVACYWGCCHIVTLAVIACRPLPLREVSCCVAVDQADVFV